MKKERYLLKTFMLTLVLLMLVNMAQGKENVVNSINVAIKSGSPLTLTYGTSGTITYTVTLNCTGGNPAGTATLSFSSGTLPSGAVSNIGSIGQIILTGGVSTFTRDFTISSATSTPAGTTNLNVTNGSVTTINPFTFIVNQRALTITGTKTYDGNATVSAAQLTAGNLVGTDAVTLGGSATVSGSGVATYNSFATNGLTSSNANYSVIGGTVSFSVSQRSLNFTGTKTYDGNVNISAAQLTAGNKVGADIVTLGGTATVSGSGVGNYDAFATNSLSSSNANYSLTGGTVTFIITKPTAVTWNGATSGDWTTASNWTPPYLPDATIDVSIPSASTTPIIANDIQAECKNLTIGSNLTIQPKGSLTVDVNLTNNAGTAGLTLLSDETGTGSLITTSATGSATVERFMAPKRWHLVSSPVTGQPIVDFLTDNGNIPSDPYANKGMRDFDPDDNVWNDFFTSATTGNLEPGKGFIMRVKTTGSQTVAFKGTLQAGTQTVDVIPGYWNCIGNPYTSAIKMNAASGVGNFIAVNAAKLEPAYGAIYVWHQAAAEENNVIVGAYEIISNVNPTSLLNDIQQGQAFMVKMNTMPLANTVEFNQGMQFHNTGQVLKSTHAIWPTIKLLATVDSVSSSTIIAFNEGMTNGLDPTYDAGLLKDGDEMVVYTRLVEDYGIPFGIQALPANDNNAVVPVGIEGAKSGKVSFSAELIHVPSACKAILEDRQNNTFTDLKVNTYTTDIVANSANSDRFFLHTSSFTTGIGAEALVQPLRAWAVGNTRMNINGPVSGKAIATLYDLQGRTVVTQPLVAGSSNQLSLPGIKSGIYLLQVRDNNQVQRIKVKVSE